MATANQLTINFSSFTYVNPPFNENVVPGILQVTITGKQVVHGAPSLTTADATLSKCNVGTIGYVYFRNTDVTLGNNIQIGSDGTLYPIVLWPGEYAIMRWNAAAMHAKAVAGTPILEYWAVEA